MAGVNVRSWRAILIVAAVFGLPLPAMAAQDSDPHSGAPPNGAARGDAVAMAMQYENGLSVPRDYRRALTLYCDAARRGDPRAFYGLGWMYLNGRGVARDDAIAVMWLHKAADRVFRRRQICCNCFPEVPPAPAQDCPRPAQTPRQAVGRVLPLASAPPAIRSVIDETAQHVGINGRLLHSVVSVEFGFNPHAVSPKMAAGLMQLMPATAERFGVHDRFDPRENVRAGAKYLRLLLDKYKGNLTLALAAYNAGEEKVEAYGGVPPYQETKTYVATIKRLCGCGE